MSNIHFIKQLSNYTTRQLCYTIFCRMDSFFMTSGRGQCRALTEKSIKMFEIGSVKQPDYSSLTDLYTQLEITTILQHHSVVSSQKNKCIICHRSTFIHLTLRRDYSIFMPYLQPVKSDPRANKILHQELSRFPLNKDVNNSGRIYSNSISLSM